MTDQKYGNNYSAYQKNMQNSQKFREENSAHTNIILSHFLFEDQSLKILTNIRGFINNIVMWNIILG